MQNVLTVVEKTFMSLLDFFFFFCKILKFVLLNLPELGACFRYAWRERSNHAFIKGQWTMDCNTLQRYCIYCKAIGMALLFYLEDVKDT